MVGLSSSHSTRGSRLVVESCLARPEANRINSNLLWKLKVNSKFKPLISGNSIFLITSKNYIVYAHDDFYFIPGWDIAFNKQIKEMPNNLYYLSGTMVQNGHVSLDCGDNLENFNEGKLLNKYNNLFKVLY